MTFILYCGSIHGFLFHGGTYITQSNVQHPGHLFDHVLRDICLI